MKNLMEIKMTKVALLRSSNQDDPGLTIHVFLSKKYRANMIVK